MKTPCDTCKKNFYGNCRNKGGWRKCERYTGFRMQWRALQRMWRKIKNEIA